jgi:hypothetical protein
MPITSFGGWLGRLLVGLVWLVSGRIFPLVDNGLQQFLLLVFLLSQ